jgi:hypothetical protein
VSARFDLAVRRRIVPVALSLLWGFALAVAAADAAAQAAAPAADVAGTWDGAIELPQGGLAVRVELRRDGDAWAGSIDIPQQGATDLPLEAIEVAGNAARFSIRGLSGEPTFEGTVAGDGMTGSFRQGGGVLPFSLRRLSPDEAAAAQPRRPQEPQPPFPYRSEEVQVASGDITLAGALTLPPGDGPYPGVVLLTGSGPQDRDESLFGHKPFLLLADRLTRGGVAVLRLDDRGVGGSGGSLEDSGYADLVADAAAAVRHLAARPEVAGDRVGLLGHSEGAIVAPQAAVAAADGAPPAFLVLLAGPAVPGAALLNRQLAGVTRAQGVPPELAVDLDRLLAAGIEVLAAGGGKTEIDARLGTLAGELAADRPEADRPVLAGLVSAAGRILAGFDRPLLRELIRHDPGPALSRVRVPVLAIYGGRDLNVPADQSAPALEAALARAGNPDATVRVLPELNHLLQHSSTGNPAEYGTIEETMSPEALDLIVGWILERFGVAEGPEVPAAAPSSSP